MATDEFGQGLNATASLSITIADEDDVAPRFTAAGYSFRIPENADIGTEVGVVLAEDDDLIESLVVYGLEGSRLFSIHPFNGELIKRKRFRLRLAFIFLIIFYLLFTSLYSFN